MLLSYMTATPKVFLKNSFYSTTKYCGLNLEAFFLNEIIPSLICIFAWIAHSDEGFYVFSNMQIFETH